jgi:hypothetical protein
MIRVERLWIDLRARRDLGRILADTKALLDRAARELRLFPRTRRWFVVPGLWVSVFWSYRRRWWTPEPSAASPAPPDAPAPGRAPSAPKPQLTYACGHKEAVASVQGRKCPGCQRADQDVKAKKKREAKRAALPRGRLPDGAVFVFRYAADGLTWSGTLTAAVGGQPREFAGAGTSVEFLQRQLGRACWQAMAEAGEVVPTAGEAPKPEGRA